jgi:hypothetical protein
VKRGGQLRRGKPLQSGGTLPRTPTRRKARPAKDWREARAKVAAEGRCRVCATREELEAAHVLGQRYDRDNRVAPEDIVPLCATCHRGPDGYDHHALNLLPHLRTDEVDAAIALVGWGALERRAMGSAWRRAA